MGRELRIRAITCGIIVACALLSCSAARVTLSPERDESVHAYNPTNLIRLHVVAAGDEGEQQLLKIDVRNAVLAEAGRILQGVPDARAAALALQANLGRIEEAARVRVAERGYALPVTASLGRFPFPPTDYGHTRLPEGDYLALRVTVGEGIGSNWWCVLFPPLCFVDVERACIVQKTADTENSTVRFELATRLFDPGLHGLASAATIHEIAGREPGMTLAQVSWEMPAWVARLVGLPDFRQAKN